MFRMGRWAPQTEQNDSHVAAAHQAGKHQQHPRHDHDNSAATATRIGSIGPSRLIPASTAQHSPWSCAHVKTPVGSKARPADCRRPPRRSEGGNLKQNRCRADAGSDRSSQIFPARQAARLARCDGNRPQRRCARMDSGDAARWLVPGPDVGPDLAPVLTDLAHHPANLGAVGERLELADQGGTFGPVQLRGQRGRTCSATPKAVSPGRPAAVNVLKAGGSVDRSESNRDRTAASRIPLPADQS